MKKNKKKLLVVMVILSSMTFTTACRDYKDVNKLLFVTSIIVDIDKDKRPVVYLEAFKPTRSGEGSSEEGEKLLFKGSGKTIFEAIRDAHLSSSLEFNYTQNKIIMYTQRAAKYGIDNYLDVFDRGQEFLVRPFVAVLLGAPEDILGVKIKAEPYLGIYLNELIDNEGQSSRAVRIHMNEFMDQRVVGSKTNIVTTIGLKKDQMEPIVEIRGGAIIKNDKMVEFMPRSDGQGYNFLMNGLNAGSLEITNPEHEDKFITLSVLKSKTKTDLDYDGKTIHLHKRIKLKTSIHDVQKELEFKKDSLDILTQKSEDNILRACKRVFNKYKDLDLDIFEIQEEFERKYPHAKVEDPIKITELDVTVEESIEGSPDTRELPK